MQPATVFLRFNVAITLRRDEPLSAGVALQVRVPCQQSADETFARHRIMKAKARGLISAERDGYIVLVTLRPDGLDSARAILKWQRVH